MVVFKNWDDGRNLERSENKNDSSFFKTHSSTEEMDVNNAVMNGNAANILSGGEWIAVNRLGDGECAIHIRRYVTEDVYNYEFYNGFDMSGEEVIV